MISGAILPEVPSDQSFASSNMSAKTELNLLISITKVGFGFLIPPFIITTFSLYAYFEIYNKILLVCPVISLVSFFASLLLIHYSREARRLNLHAPAGMFYALYVIHFCAASLFFVGFLLMFLFRKEDLLSKINFSLLLIEGGAIKYILGYAVLFVQIKKLTIEYQSISNYIQIMQITISICGLGIFLASLTYQTRWDNLDISYHVPPIILHLGIIAGIIVIFLSFLSFYGSYKERLTVLLLSQIITIILIIFLFMLTGILYKSNEIYINMIEENCDYLLKIVHKDLLTCQKYVSSPCPDNFLALAWEDSSNELCVNQSCCQEITKDVVLSLQILMSWTLLTAVLLLFSWFAGQGLVKKVEKYGKNSEKNFDFKAFVLLLFIYLVIVAGWAVFVDTSSVLKKNSVKVKVLDAEVLSPNFTARDLCRTIKLEVDMPEDFEKIVLSAKNGILLNSELSGKKKKVQEELENLVYCPEYVSSFYVIEIDLIQNEQ